MPGLADVPITSGVDSADYGIVIKDGGVRRADPTEMRNLVGAASDIAAGVARLATEAEAQTGASTTTLMTPANTHATIPFWIAPPPSGDTTGVTDKARLQALIDDAEAEGLPVEIRLHRGTYYASGLVMKTWVHLSGAGRYATNIKAPNSVNEDVIITKDFATLTGGTTQGGPHSWSITGMTLDGNRANNTTGWCLRVYGRRYSLTDVRIREGKSGGWWSEWGTGGTEMAAHITDVTACNCEGTVVHFIGPQDSVFSNVIVFNDSTQPDTTGKLLVVDGLANGSQFSNVHAYGNGAVAIEISTPSFWSNAKAQVGAGGVRSVLVESTYVVWTNGWIAGTDTNAATEIGLEFGAGASSTGCRFTDVFFSRFGTASYPVKWAATGGYNEVTGTVQGTPAAMETGTKASTDRVSLRTPGVASSDAGVSPVDRLFLPANSFVVTAGSPDQPVTSYPVMRFDAATSESATRSVILPADWRSYTAVVWWTNGGAGTGNVKWFVAAAEIPDDSAFGAFTTRSPAAEAAPAASTSATTASGAAWSVTARIQYVRIQRDAAHADDTLANDANVIGVELIRAS